MPRKRILFICGSLNQTTMMHKISNHLKDDYDCQFTPFYCDGVYKKAQQVGLLDWTIIGGQNRRTTEAYFQKHGMPVDYAGSKGNYDLHLTCTDLLVQENLKNNKLILVQEGMTDPENMMYHIVRHTHRAGVPRWLASTASTGLSDAYVKFCVASDGYKDHFVKKGVRPDKIAVTGIPNFDHVAEYLDNDFPYKDYVLVATTDTRENFKYDNRKAFILKAVEIAEGRQLIFRFHPNENHSRSIREINKYAPGALGFNSGNTNHMIANCHTLITQYSSTVYIGIALGKVVYSYFDVDSLKLLTPIQNGGKSAANIAEVCRQYV